MASEGGGGNNTSLGVSENVASLLAYLLTWITGIIFLLIEKENQTVRFHAMQSIAVFVPLSIAYIIFSLIPGIGGFLAWVTAIVTFVAWIFLMFQAFQGNRFKMPYVGEWAEKQLS